MASELEAQLSTLGDDDFAVSVDAKNKDSVVHTGKGITSIKLTRKHPLVRKLNVAGNALTSLQTVRRLPALTMLSAQRNALTAQGITPLLSLRTLVSLNLSHNKLETLPREPFVCGALASLQALVLSHNALRDISALALCPMPSLTTLVLSNNALGSAAVPSTASASSGGDDDAAAVAERCGGLSINVLHGFPLLERLNLSHNQLVEVPPVWTLPNIMQLRLVGNRLTTLPQLPAGGAGVGGGAAEPCQQLRILDLGLNQLSGEWLDCAAPIAAFAPRLQQLGLRGNRFDGVPAEKSQYLGRAEPFCSVLWHLRSIDGVVVNERHVKRVKRRRAYGNMIKEDTKQGGTRSGARSGTKGAAKGAARSSAEGAGRDSSSRVPPAGAKKIRAPSSKAPATGKKARALDEAAALLAAAARARIAERARTTAKKVKKAKKKEKKEKMDSTKAQKKKKKKKKKKKEKEQRGEDDADSDGEASASAFASVSGVLAVDVVERAALPHAAAAAHRPKDLKQWLAKSATPVASGWD